MRCVRRVHRGVIIWNQKALFELPQCSDKDAERDNEYETHESFQVRLPGFVNDEDIGLGTVIKRMTYALGIKPCGDCEGRAEVLDRHVTFAEGDLAKRRNRPCFLEALWWNQQV